MISTVTGTYPDIAWDITPELADGKLKLPSASVNVCNVAYQLPTAEFELKSGTVYLTPSGYVFVSAEESTDTLEKFPNRQNYWVCSADEKGNILVLRAVINS
jgi:hypothetical protein